MSNEKKNDGGPAYPRTGHVHSQDCEPEQWIKGNEGMSLRDYFAGLAMQQMAEWLRVCDYGLIDDTAMLAYRYADAMLKAREQ